jgi:hypothetical protein
MARGTHVAAVIGDLEHFVGEVLKLTCPRQSVPAAKFLMASEPTAYCGLRRHPGARTDGPKAFAVDEPETNHHSNLGVITGRSAAPARVVGVHGGLSRILVRRGCHSAGVVLGRHPIRGRRRDRTVGVGRQRGALRRVDGASRLHISDYRLPAIIDVNVLDADILVSAVAEAAKGLDLRGIGPHQPSRGCCECHDSALSATATPEPRQDRHSSGMRAGHLNGESPFDFILRCRGLD